MLIPSAQPNRKDTNGTPDFDAKLKPEEVVLKITTLEATNNPDYRLIHTAYLRNGKRAYKVAVMYEIISRNTGEFKHYVLDIISLQKLKRGWFFTYESKFTLSGENGEIDALYNFLKLFHSHQQPENAGTYYNVPEEEYNKLAPIKEVDFLLGTNNFTTLIEMKRPDTPLFSGESNRSGSWQLSDNLTHAVSQILEQKAEWLIKSQVTQYDKERKPINQKTYDTKTILLIGNSNQFEGVELDQVIKAKTFELYRRNLKDVEIITFDELYERANFIVNE